MACDLRGRTDRELPAATLTEGLDQARWYSGKGRPIVATREIDSASVPGGECRLCLIEVDHSDRSSERYLVVENDASGAEPEIGSGAWSAICRFMLSGDFLLGERGGSFRGEANGHDATHSPPRVGRERSIGDDQSNTLVVIDDSVVLKLYRRPTDGVHPETELLAALTGSQLTPGLLGSLTYAAADGQSCTLAVGLEYVESTSFGIEGPVQTLAAFLENGGRQADLAVATELFASAGAITGKLHTELSRQFGMESASSADLAVWRRRAEDWLSEARQASGAGASEALAGQTAAIEKALARLVATTPPPMTRIHGDLHIGQFLATDRGLLVIDFEGDPLRSLTERRQLDTPMRDVACLLRSVDHVASAAGKRVFGDPSHVRVRQWIQLARSRTLNAYRTTAGTQQLELDPELLFTLEVAKECGELLYAARVVPDWSYAPIAGMQRLLASSRG